MSRKTEQVMAPVISAFAPAKINLALHITGHRADGYHLLDSLVMLVDVGDSLSVRPAPQTRLRVTGPRAAGIPVDDSNLVFKAARMMGVSAKIVLEKHLPAAAGIGGGSSDAAACLRALCACFDLPLPDVAAQLTLSADVPVCMVGGLVRMRGIGEMLDPLGEAPDWPMILVNPGAATPTGPVFAQLKSKENAPLPEAFPLKAPLAEQIRWLSRQRNDLEPPALDLVPVIGEVLAALRAREGCLLARMSGSGATCFSIMSSFAARDQAVSALRDAHPEWWIMPTRRCDPLAIGPRAGQFRRSTT